MRAGVHTNSAADGRAARIRGRRLAAALASAVLLLFLATSCSFESGGGSADATRARTLELARGQLSRAAEALRAGDRAAFTAALPAGGAGADASQVRDGLDAVYEALAPLPWTSFRFIVEPLRGQDGVYRVAGSGQLGSTSPADRLAVVRYVRLSAEADGVVVTGDATPESLRRRYLMALHDPVVLQRPGFVVLADHWARDRAHLVMESAERARTRLKAFGLDTGPSVLVTIYGSAEDVRDALGTSLPTVRLRFFAHDPLHAGKEKPPVEDVGVMGPWLRDAGQSIDGVFVHELTHAYTRRWFEGDDTPPALLVEGIAAAAQGGSAAPGLREEVASGDSLWPLPESFAVDDVWDGGDIEAIDLGYEVGRSLVDYVDTRWGAAHLEAFVRAVATAEPTEAGMDVALGDALAVSWDEFYTGWRRWVLRGG